MSRLNSVDPFQDIVTHEDLSKVLDRINDSLQHATQAFIRVKNDLGVARVNLILANFWLKDPVEDSI